MKYYNNKVTKYLDSIKKKEDNVKQKSTSKSTKKAKGKKKNALLISHDGSQYWTTQKQFWQGVREKKIEKIGDNPLTGKVIEKNSEKDVILANTILNISRPRHLSEALSQRKFKKKK